MIQDSACTQDKLAAISVGSSQQLKDGACDTAALQGDCVTDAKCSALHAHPGIAGLLQSVASASKP